MALTALLFAQALAAIPVAVPVQAFQRATLLDSARAALERGAINRAVDLAERHTLRYPNNAEGFYVVAQAYGRRMPAGRFNALNALRAGRRLAPNDVRFPWQMVQMGLYLGSDDGEAIAREALERVIELDPHHADAYALWLTLFRGGGYRRRMIARLAAHPADPVLWRRTAALLIEEEAYDSANAMLDVQLRDHPADPALLALRAQSAYETGADSAGHLLYERALAAAAQDTADVLWTQVVGIATPAEIRSWLADVTPARRGAWLRAFWSRRHPSLFASRNDRVAEHFRRLRHARKRYPLLHPLVSYHRSQIARSMNLEPSLGEREYNTRCEMTEVMLPPEMRVPRDENGRPLSRQAMQSMSEEQLAAALRLPPTLPPGVSSARDRARLPLSPLALLTADERARVGFLTGLRIPTPLFAAINMSLRDVDSTAARLGYNLATGLDDRGIMYLRFGPPEQMAMGGNNPVDPQCNVPDVERWRYPHIGEVRFARPSAFSRGERNVPDMVFRPMNVEQFEAMREGITRDETSRRAELAFGVWTAQFAAAEAGRTAVVVVATTGTLAAQLVTDAAPGEAAQSSSGIVTVAGPAGRQVLLAHAEQAGLLGRQSLTIGVRALGDAPGLSDLLLAPSWDRAPANREEMLRHLRRDLTFGADERIRVFAELYGLDGGGGQARAVVQYQLLRTGNPARDITRESWPEALVFQFDRVYQTGAGPVTETLDLTPERLGACSYLLRLTARDGVDGRDLGRSTIAFTVR